MLQGLSKCGRRAWFMNVLAALALKAQTWIPPVRKVANARMWGLTTKPVCPACGAIGSGPSTPIVVANADGSFSGCTLANAYLFVCRSCGCLFAGFTA